MITLHGSNRLLLYITAAMAMALFSGCIRRVADHETSAALVEDRVIEAVATTGMVGDVVRNIGGDRVNVMTMMSAGIDPHSYKARESDVLAIAGADIVFYNGLHLEAKLGEVFEKLGSRMSSVAIAETMPEESLHSPEDYEGYHDPHVWFDVELWMLTIEPVREALAELDPAHADGYQARADAYLAELHDLHTYVTARVADIPEGQRVLITAHDAFGYFGAAYGFEVLGLQGISTEAEAGTADVRGLAEFIAERKIRALFVESSVPERNIRAVQEAVRARGFETAIGGELFSDAMGPEGTPEGTYTGMVKHNIDTIADALTGVQSAHH